MTIPRNLSFLAQGASSTGVLSVPYGGTGLTSFTAGYIPYGNGTGALGSNSNLFWDSENNRLGIGTTSPANSLNIVADNTPYRGQLSLQTVSASNFAQISFYDRTTLSAQIYQEYGGSVLNILTSVSSPIAFGTNGTERMRLFPSGGVSIGNTTDPGATNLSVTGTVKATGGVLLGTSTLALTDYQEGTFTPNQGGAVTVVGAYSSSGTYTKIGNLVTVTAIQNGATSIAVAASGQLFTNAPFTVNSSGSRYSGTCALQFTAACGAIAVGGTTNVYSAGTLSGGATIVTTITYQV